MSEFTTRIDLEEVHGGVMMRCWNEGWREGDRPAVERMLPGRALYHLLREGEAKGYSVTQFDATTARLLRGEVVRIDFAVTPDGVRVQQYPYGWTAKTRPVREEVLAQSLEELTAQYGKDSGWRLYQWIDGARAFKEGHLHPVRSSREIVHLRRQLEARRGFLNRVKNGHFIDLAYEL